MVHHMRIQILFETHYFLIIYVIFCEMEDLSWTIYQRKVFEQPSISAQLMHQGTSQ